MSKGWYLGILSILSACNFNPDYTENQLAGNYSVGTDYEGFSTLYYQKWPWRAKISLGPLDSAAVFGDKLIVSSGGGEDSLTYYLLPLRPVDANDADGARDKPINFRVYRRWCLQQAPDLVPALTYVR